MQPSSLVSGEWEIFRRKVPDSPPYTKIQFLINSEMYVCIIVMKFFQTLRYLEKLIYLNGVINIFYNDFIYFTVLIIFIYFSVSYMYVYIYITTIFILIFKSTTYDP